MSLSNSRDFTLTLDEIITNIGDKLLIGETETNNIKFRLKCKQNINLFIKELQAYNIFLWSTYWETQALTASSQVTGSDSNIYTCILGHTSSTDNKPVTGNDWRKFWYKRGSTGGTWNASTAYSAIGDFALSSDVIGLEKAFLKDTDIDKPIELIGKHKYYEINNKENEGVPTQLYFEPALTPHCYLDRQPDNTSPTYLINLLKIKKLQDFDNWTNNPDFYTKLFNCIIWNVSYIMSFNYKTISEETKNRFQNELIKSNMLLKKGNIEYEDNTFCKGAF